MCFSSPKVETVDAEAEQEEAKVDATVAANEKTAAAAQKRKKQTLLASGSESSGNAQTSSVLAYGKSTFGS